MADPVTTITWGINTLERYTSTGIVYLVHYRIDATDGTYQEGAYGSVGLEAPPEEGYTVIPYDSLNKETCLAWTFSALGDEQVKSIEKTLEDRLTEKRSPTKALGTPWSAES